MNTGWLRKMPPRWQARVIRWSFNWHPAYRATGGRVEHVSADMRHIRVSLKLTRRTRNVFGSLFGGALFAVTDGPHPAMLAWQLGPDYIIWDKFASIRYRKPGFDTLYADFHMPADEIAQIHESLREQAEIDRQYTVALCDAAGVVHALVERTLYIAHKAHYTQKTHARSQP
jgi:hypothetical protein